MLIVAIAVAAALALAVSPLRRPRAGRVSVGRRRGATAVVVVTAAVLPIMGGLPAGAEIIPTVPMGSLINYSVVANQTVTSTGPSFVNGIALSPGSAVTGFPPGTNTGALDIANGPAVIAQTDLTTAYNDAAGRTATAITDEDLGGLTLVGGAYNATAAGPLTLTGTLTLDGAYDPNSVWVFQTDSSLITAASSVVSLINGAQECNVFWKVTSSATLGLNSSFAGNILALASVTATTGATVRGRALASTGAVTLDSNVFTVPTCDFTPIQAPTTTTVPGGVTTTSTGGGGGATTTTRRTTTTRPELPSTGGSFGAELLVAGLFVAGGAAAVGYGWKRRTGPR